MPKHRTRTSSRCKKGSRKRCRKTSSKRLLKGHYYGRKCPKKSRKTCSRKYKKRSSKKMSGGGKKRCKKGTRKRCRTRSSKKLLKGHYYGRKCPRKSRKTCSRKYKKRSSSKKHSSKKMSGGAASKRKRCSKGSRRRCRSKTNKRKYTGSYSGTYTRCPNNYRAVCKKNHEYIMFLTKFVKSRANKAKYPNFKERRQAGIDAWNARKSSSKPSGPSFAKVVAYLFGDSESKPEPEQEPECYKDMCKQGIKTKKDFVKYILEHSPDKTGKELTGKELEMWTNINECTKQGKYCKEE